MNQGFHLTMSYTWESFNFLTGRKRSPYFSSSVIADVLLEPLNNLNRLKGQKTITELRKSFKAPWSRGDRRQVFDFE